MPEITTVLIVGGGLNGLTTAVLLAHHRVPCLVVERHEGTSIQYKFAGISPRSMEIYRSVGLEEEIRAHRTGDQQGGGIARGRTLADPGVQWSGPAWPDASPFSPTQPATCDQHVLEPILRRQAEALGADVRFSTELLDIEQDAREVRARIRDRASGAEQVVTADYLVAADGANGSTRERLGIPRSGAGALQHWMNIIFETDMPSTIDGRRFTSYFATDLNGTFTPREDGRWLLALQYFPERGERPEDFDRARCRELVRRGAGRSDVKADLVDARAWEVAATVADRFQERRSFLVGDAAHLMPPTGAFGGNTGIHDAHNLAWKLALVSRNEADPDLLETYDEERRPVVNATLAQALARLQQWFKDPAKRLPPPVEMVGEYDVVLGQRYDEGAIVPEGPPPSRPFEPVDQLSGRPGTRAPHLPIERDGRTVSTLDLFDRGFVLLTADHAWREAADGLRARAAVPLTCHSLGNSGDLRDRSGTWRPKYGIEEDGASLVRPDGVVAWRSRPGEHASADLLSRVFQQIGLRLPPR